MLRKIIFFVLLTAFVIAEISLPPDQSLDLFRYSIIILSGLMLFEKIGYTQGEYVSRFSIFFMISSILSGAISFYLNEIILYTGKVSAIIISLFVFIFNWKLFFMYDQSAYITKKYLENKRKKMNHEKYLKFLINTAKSLEAAVEANNIIGKKDDKIDEQNEIVKGELKRLNRL